MILCHNKTVLDGLNLYGYQNLVSIPLKIPGIVSYRIVLVSYRIVLVSYRIVSYWYRIDLKKLISPIPINFLTMLLSTASPKPGYEVVASY